MVPGNLNYFYSILNISSSVYSVNYDFSSSSASGTSVPSVPNANSLYSGILSSTGNYYSVSGSGLFNGNTINIQNASGLNSTYFTMIFGYEKNYSGNAILFSSLNSGNGVISGFNIGLNDSNKLYFETVDQNGAYIVTSSNIYSSKNAIAIVKSNNTLNFHYYNFNYQKVESETFTISSLALYNSNQVYLAGTGSGTPSYITQKNFSGYLSEFIYINTALTQSTVQNLFSGFYCTKNPSTTGIISYSSGAGFITGGAAIYTGIGTGITGQQIFLAGTYIDFCGNSHSIYSYNTLTGIISGYDFFPLTGAVIYTGTGLIDQGYNIDTGFAASFGMDGVVYNRYKQLSDFNEFYYFPAILTTNLNNNAKYNIDGTFKLSSISSNNLINLYFNGQANIVSGYTTTGTVYVQTVVLLGDYLVSGQSIVSLDLYQSTDAISYDYISGINEVFSYTGNNQSFSLAYPNNRLVFLNGVKIISGLNYNLTSNNLNVSGFNGTGIIFTFPNQMGYKYQSGNFNNFQTTKFARGASELWMNGQKQIINNDYYEISKIDLLNGSGLFQTFPNLIYNNNGTFTQII